MTPATVASTAPGGGARVAGARGARLTAVVPADRWRAACAPTHARAGAMSMAELADALLALVGKLRGEMPAIVSLLDARSDWSAKRSEFRSAVRTHIAQTLVLCSSHLDAVLAGDIAIVLLNVMKTMARMTRESGVEVGPGAMTELREMTRLYLESRLAQPL